VLGSDKVTDMAVLKIEAGALPVAGLPRSAARFAHAIEFPGWANGCWQSVRHSGSRAR
jgi:S1-C subfamily serine protease